MFHSLWLSFSAKTANSLCFSIVCLCVVQYLDGKKFCHCFHTCWKHFLASTCICWQVWRPVLILVVGFHYCNMVAFSFLFDIPVGRVLPPLIPAKFCLSVCLSVCLFVCLNSLLYIIILIHFFLILCLGIQLVSFSVLHQPAVLVVSWLWVKCSTFTTELWQTNLQWSLYFDSNQQETPTPVLSHGNGELAT